MLIVGLTGSIGMGKSTVAEFFRNAGVAMLDADAVVHDLYAGPGVAPIADAFPTAVVNGVIDRGALSLLLKQEPGRLAELEAIVHPLVRAAQRSYLQAQADAGAQICGLEIPLLFETGGDARVDVTVVVSTPADVQRSRVLSRPDMTAAKLEMILARQLPDDEKRRRADHVIDTGTTLDRTREQVMALVAVLSGQSGSGAATAWDIQSNTSPTIN